MAQSIPKKETKRIHRYVHYRNQQNEKKYEQAIEKGYLGDEFLNKIVPEEVFQKYDYLFEDSSTDFGNVNIVNAVLDDNWGEPIDFSVEEMLDMPIEGEVQLNMASINCVGQNDLCKVVTNNSEAPKQDVKKCKTGYYKEPDYIEADSESQGEKVRHEPFCVTGKDSDYIDIDDLY